MSEPANQNDVLDAVTAPAPPSSQAGARPTLLGRVGRVVTPALVFIGLGALLFWGHRTGWALPKFSSVLGSAAANDDWCSEHGVPESLCVECNPEMMPKPKSFGWCKLHGVHECPLCHPEVAQLKSPPRITAADLDKANRALEFAERPENNSKCKSHEHRIQFVSPETMEKAGVEVEPVWTAPVVETITPNGEITYDQTRTARLSARVPGSVFQVYKNAGDAVKKGEVLALIDAAEVGKAKAELLQALVQVRLKKKNLEEMATTGPSVGRRELRDMEAAVSEANIRLTTAQEAMTNLGLPVDVESLNNVAQEKLADRLRFLGLPESLTATFDPKKTTGNLLAVTAPFDGVAVNRQVVNGEVVDSAKALFVVADIRQMWLILDLRMEDAKFVRLGQKVRFRPDGSKVETAGEITWVSTEADSKTRTVKARAILDNAQGRFRANTFGLGRIILREEPQAIVVPNSAVHWEGDCFVAFVRDKNFLDEGAPKVFHIRTVRIGAQDDQQTEIIAGLLPGEVVATKGSAALRGQLLRSNLGEA